MIRLPVRKGYFHAVAFAPDGGRVAAAGTGKRLVLWGPRSPDAPVRYVTGEHGKYRFVGFAGPDRVLAVSHYGSVIAGDLAGAGWLTGPPPRSGWLAAAALSPDGTSLYVTGFELRRWELGESARGAWSVNGTRPHSGFQGVAVAPQGDRIVAALASHTSGLRCRIHVRDAATGQVLSTVAEPEGLVERLEWSPDGRWIAGRVNRSVRVWDAATGEQVAEPKTPARRDFAALKFHPDGRTLAVGGVNGVIHLFETETWRAARSYQWDLGMVYDLAFAPDGLRAAAAGKTGVALWDVDE